MSILNRISNIVRAKANGAIDEMENPIELLDQKIRDMEESLNTAKLSSAQILGNVHEIEKKMENASKESKDFDEKIKLAMSKGNEELARKALQKKLEADGEYSKLKNSYQEAALKGETIKTKLKDLEEEIDKTRYYRDEAAARFNNADASSRVNEILANIETGKNKISMEDIERKIQRKEALAEGMEDLRVDDSLDKEFEKLESVDLEEELKKYKYN
jgi:phage shock protein A